MEYTASVRHDGFRKPILRVREPQLVTSTPVFAAHYNARSRRLSSAAAAASNSGSVHIRDVLECTPGGRTFRLFTTAHTRTAQSASIDQSEGGYTSRRTYVV